MPDTPEKPKRDYTIRLDDDEVAAIREMTKVDAVAPAVVAIVRTAIEQRQRTAPGGAAHPQ